MTSLARARPAEADADAEASSRAAAGGDEGRVRHERQARLLQAYLRVRAQSLELAEGLSAEDCMLQSMPDASPVKWHLAHVTWFFETFVLASARKEFRPFDAAFRVLFNSYYVGVGARHPRPERGLLSRPALTEVLDYRKAVDEQMQELLAASILDGALLDIVELGVHHEQQHQELILTDLKHHFSRNPLHPVYRGAAPAAGPALGTSALAPMDFIAYPGGRQGLGHAGGSFGFDNESPRHEVLVAPFELAARPVANGEYLAFIADGGYQRPELWLSDGWDQRTSQGWEAPLYWKRDAEGWQIFTLSGLRPLDPAEPACHLSYYEADACARWLGGRLPTEAEWESAAVGQPIRGNFLEDGRFHPSLGPAPTPPGGRATPGQMYGDVWEWTQSAYLPYPGFQTAPGAVGEYNGKFMINQMVLRGGSCATPRDHIRPSYRNFFPPQARWQFSGLRIARDLAP